MLTVERHWLEAILESSVAYKRIPIFAPRVSTQIKQSWSLHFHKLTCSHSFQPSWKIQCTNNVSSAPYSTPEQCNATCQTTTDSDDMIFFLWTWMGQTYTFVNQNWCILGILLVISTALQYGLILICVNGLLMDTNLYSSISSLVFIWIFVIGYIIRGGFIYARYEVTHVYDIARVSEAGHTISNND